MQRETRIRQMTKRPQGLDQSSALLVLGLRPLCGTLMATGAGQPDRPAQSKNPRERFRLPTDAVVRT